MLGLFWSNLGSFKADLVVLYRVWSFLIMGFSQFLGSVQSVLTGFLKIFHKFDQFRSILVSFSRSLLIFKQTELPYLQSWK